MILNCDPNGVGSYLEMARWDVDWLGMGLGSGRGWTCGIFSMDLHCLFVENWYPSGWAFDPAVRPHGYVENLLVDLLLDLCVGMSCRNSGFLGQFDDFGRSEGGLGCGFRS